MKRVLIIFVLISFFAQIQFCQGNKKDKTEEGKMKMSITSAAFAEGEMIPVKYTCDGEDISPPISWQGVPSEAKSLVLICDDPDAPMGTWVHWVIYDLSPQLSGLPENVPSEARLSMGGVHGKSSWRRLGYGGPCPPSGTHRYFFKLYALDTKLNLAPGATKEEVLEKMENHILAKATLMGTYRRG